MKESVKLRKLENDTRQQEVIAVQLRTPEKKSENVTKGFRGMS